MSRHCPVDLRRINSSRASRLGGSTCIDEKLFLAAVSEGDLNKLKMILRKKEIGQKCCEYRSLDIAVDKNNIEVITFLLDNLKINEKHYYCAILRAVFNDTANIVDILLERAQNDKQCYSRLRELMSGSSKCTDCVPDFAVTNLTPLMAAAIRGNVEITQLLLERGFAIQQALSHKCSCSNSSDDMDRDGETLTESMNRMNIYRALTSPTYLLLTSEDPILESFKMSRETKNLSLELPENQKEYKDLSKQCSNFATDLLNQCRNTQEVQLVLTRTEGFEDQRPHRFSRLHLAVQYQQKEFVTHPSCQQVLRSMWVESLGSWYSWSFGRRSLYIIKHALLTPVVSLGFIFIPRAEVLGPLRVPLHRFIYSATSYLVFLCLLLVTLLNDRRYDITSPVTWTEVAVGCFVLGHSWEILTNLLSKKCKNYFRSSWSVFDLVMFSMFLLAEILWFIVFMINIRTSEKTYHSDRMHWKWYHPVLIGEAIYACASVMAFIRLFLWFQVNSRLGPLGTSIKYMVVDVTRFFILLFIIMLAFSIGLNSIYKNYRRSSKDDANEEDQQPEDFLTLKAAFKSLFWAIFGMAEPDFAQILVSDKNNISTGEHFFTEGVGYTLWGLYHLVTVVILLNMVIAMMTESYQRVQTNSDMEWKFACSTLWLTVFDPHCVVPPPFNLIPSMHRVSRFFLWVLHYIRHRQTDVSWSCPCCFCCQPITDASTKITEDEEYKELMIQLARRYLHWQRQLSTTTALSTNNVDFKEKLREEMLQEIYRTFKREKNKCSC